MPFIVRAAIDDNGLVCGVVVDTQTGRKEPFAGTEQLGTVITAMASPDGRSDSGLARLDRNLPVLTRSFN